MRALTILGFEREVRALTIFAERVHPVIIYIHMRVVQSDVIYGRQNYMALAILMSLQLSGMVQRRFADKWLFNYLIYSLKKLKICSYLVTG